MKLEQNENALLFSFTNIPDIFFTEYFSEATGDSIKVYLYLLFLSKYNKEIKLNDLSKKLALPLPVIQNSIKYWEDLNIITKKNTGYIINNLQEIELYNLYSPKVALSSDKIENNIKNQSRAKAIEDINNSFFQGIMSPAWYADIDLWFKTYSFDEHVMIALFRYCFEKSALHRNYVKTVAEAWNQNNIKTFNDLDLYYEKQDKLNKLKKSITKKLGLSRSLTQYEEAYIEKWYFDFGYSLDIIELALKKTTSKSNPSFDYIDKIIADWHDRNLKTINDIQTFLIEFKNQKQKVKELEKKTNYQNYDQRAFTDFDSLYANKQEA